MTTDTGGNPPPAWHASLDADTKGWADNKGFIKLDTADKVIPELIKGYRNAESIRGIPADELERFPKDMTKPGALDAIFTRLGRPADAKGYGLARPDGLSADQTAAIDALEAHFHKLGLTKAQATEHVKYLTEQHAAAQEAQATAAQVALDAGKTELSREWGGTTAVNTERALQAAHRFGLNDEQIADVQEALGYGPAMKFLQKIGEKIGEDTYVGNGDGNRQAGLPSTPDGARARIAELKKDSEFVRKLQSGDADANRQWKALHVTMSGKSEA